MDRFSVDHRHLKKIAGELAALAGRMDVLDDNHYLRNTMRVEKSGSQELMDACGDFENEWAFGRDRLQTKMNSFAEFLTTAAETFAQADAAMSGTGSDGGGGAADGVGAAGL